MHKLLQDDAGSLEHFQRIMEELLLVAQSAAAAGEVPVAAALLDSNFTEVAVTENQRERTQDPLAHAEVLAIQQAAKQAGSWNLDGYTLVVTLEPCLLCAAAIQAARISRVVYGAWDEKAGAVGSVYDILRDRRLPFTTEVISGVLAKQSAEMLVTFFQSKRAER